MLWVVLGIALAALVSQLSLVVLFYRLWKNLLQEHREEKKFWQELQKDQLNRLMAKDWTEYVQVSQSENQSSPSESVGMSDEEELRRIQEYFGQGTPVGETLADLTPDLEELGLKAEADG